LSLSEVRRRSARRSGQIFSPVDLDSDDQAGDIQSQKAESIDSDDSDEIVLMSDPIEDAANVPIPVPSPIAVSKLQRRVPPPLPNITFAATKPRSAAPIVFPATAASSTSATEASSSSSLSRSAAVHALERESLPPIDVERAYGEKANLSGFSFKDQVQRDMVASSLGGARDHIIVTKTGHGKSLVYLVPALLDPTGVSVVIAPLVVLKDDISRRLDELRIKYTLVDANFSNVPITAQIILCSFEATPSSNWQHTLNSLHRVKPIRRIVVDEGHLIASSQSYRKAFCDSWALRVVPAPIFVLTATCPPAMESFLTQELALQAPVVFRTTAVRPELEHIIMEPLDTMEDVVAVAVVVANQFIQESEEDERVMVIVQRKEDGEQISRQLQCGFIHGGSEKQSHAAYQAELAHRAKLFSAWVGPSGSKAIAGTTAMSAGHDVSKLHCVIFCGTPREGTEWLQACGRAGRDGAVSSCIVIPERATKYREAELAKLPNDITAKKMMFELVYRSPRTLPQACVNFAISRTFDSRDSVPICCLDSAEMTLCSFCKDLDATAYARE